MPRWRLGASASTTPAVTTVTIVFALLPVLFSIVYVNELIYSSKCHWTVNDPHFTDEDTEDREVEKLGGARICFPDFRLPRPALSCDLFISVILL